MPDAILPGYQSDYTYTWQPDGVRVQNATTDILFENNDILQFGGDFNTFDLSLIQQPNTPPVAVDDPDSGAFLVDQDTVLIISKATLLANDFDADGDTFGIVSVQDSVNGTVSMDANDVTFISNAGYFGPAEFKYTIEDEHGVQATATVSITVNQVIPPNNPPVAIDDGIYQVDEGASIDISQLELLSNDFDPDNDLISFVDAFNPINGSVAVIGQDVVFTADRWLGPASFEYSITDGEAQDTATVSLNVNAVSTGCNPDPDGYVAAIMAEPELPDMPAMLALVPRNQATCVAICDGNWSDPNIWWNGVIPSAGDKVLIPHDRIVDYDYSYPGSLDTVRVDGVLSFSDTVNTLLPVDTLVNTSTGTIYADTPAGVTTSIVIADNGPIDTTWDPTLLSRGLISHGTAHLKGAAKKEFCKPSVIPLAGDTTFVFDSAPNGWEVGDKLVITATHWQHQFNSVDSEDEEVTIDVINGGVIGFTPALQFDHNVPRADLSPYVANLTRNVRIVGPDTVPSERGHVMFMHNNDVDIRYVEFADLGRTDKSVPAFDGGSSQSPTDNIKGRYSCHFHFNGFDMENPVMLVGCVAAGNPGWGFVHHSCHANFSRNIFYDGVGAGFAAEDGDETGIWYQNLAIKVAKLKGYGSAVEKFIEDLERDDMGRFGEGFFMHGRLVQIAENVAASCTHGFCWQHRGPITDPLEEHLHQPEISWGQSRVPVRQTVIQGMRDNEAFCCAQGLLILKSGPHQEHDLISTFGRMLAWEVYFGCEISYTSNYTMIGWDFIHTTNPYKGIPGRNEIGSNAYGMIAVGWKMEGFGTGFDWADSWAGMPAPSDNDVSVIMIDPEFINNDTDIGSHDPNRLRVLDSATDLNPGVLTDDFGPNSWTLGNDYWISGTKTDSIGTINRPAAGALHGCPAWRISDLINKFGYYTLPTGEFVMVFEDYIADRATGELHKKGEIITLNVSQSKLNQWGTPYHGEINPGGSLPDADDVSVVTPKNTDILVDVLANAHDPDGGSLVISGITNPKEGDAWQYSDPMDGDAWPYDGDVIRYRPNLGFTGTDQFHYWAQDERGNFSRATVTVTVG